MGTNDALGLFCTIAIAIVFLSVKLRTVKCAQIITLFTSKFHLEKLNLYFLHAHSHFWALSSWRPPFCFLSSQVWQLDIGRITAVYLHVHTCSTQVVCPYTSSKCLSFLGLTIHSMCAPSLVFPFACCRHLGHYHHLLNGCKLSTINVGLKHLLRHWIQLSWV